MSNDLSGNVDAAALYFGEEDGYCIMFNSRKIGSFDFAPNRRCNFTLAHELGHIFLGHLFIPYELKSETQRLYEEREADEFAARLLMPENLLLQCNFITGLTGQFLVTSQALFIRVNNLKRLDLYKTKPLPTCKTCGNTHFSPCAKYCKICGTEVNNFTTRGILSIVYSKLANDKNECQSGHENDRNARYCELCGQPTIFHGILPTWHVERERYIKSLLRAEHRRKKTY
ncbi:ImmA/IrrE family metallo-endopeptidase [Desulfosporosinus burensis]